MFNLTKGKNMKKNILRVLKMTAFYTFLGVLLQALLVNIMIASSPAEGQNLRDIKLSMKAVNVTLEDAFNIVSSKTNFVFTYSKEDLPLKSNVVISVEDESLYHILEMLAVDYNLVFNRINNHIVVKKNYNGDERILEQIAAEVGAIKGRITDAKTGEPLIAANITLKGTTKGAATDLNGYYVFENLKPGNYTILAQFVGYSSKTENVVVQENRTTEINFVLVQSAYDLDEVTVTGSLNERNNRENSASVYVITEKDLKNRSLTNIGDAFQGVTGFLQNAAFLSTSANERGRALGYSLVQLNLRGYEASRLGNGQPIKLLLNGVEVTDRILNLLNPDEIEKIEVSKGPMSSSLYGSGSSSGIVNIITKKRGSGINTTFQIQIENQESYFFEKNPMSTNYKLGFNGTESGINFRLGFDYYTSPADRYASPNFNGFVDEKNVSFSGQASGNLDNVNLTLRTDYSYAKLGIPTVESLYMVATHEGWENPELFLESQGSFSGLVSTVNNLTTNLNLKQILSDNFYHNLVLGYSSASIVYTDNLPNPYADSLYYYSNGEDIAISGKYYFFWNNNFSPNIKLDITAGVSFLRQSFHSEDVYLTKPLDDNSSQMITTLPYNQTYGFADDTYGIFAEGVWGLNNVLFLTTGLRTEKNDSYGDDVGWYTIPRIGLTYVNEFDDFTLKPRFSWGSSTQAVNVLFKTGEHNEYYTLLPNPNLKPQTQSGFELGIDIFYHNNYSLSVTYYNQKVENLVEAKFVSFDPLELIYFNQSEVSNIGWEFSARARLFPFSFALNGTISQSKYGEGFVDDETQYNYKGKTTINVPVSSFYAEVAYEIPALLNWSKQGGRILFNYEYHGKQLGWDFLTFYKNGSTGPWPSDLPPIWTEPFSFFNFRFDYGILDQLFLYIDIKNLTNKQPILAFSSDPLLGRRTVVGLNYNL